MNKYFTRIFTEDQLQEILYKLESEFGAPPRYRGDLTEVFAPDGDKVVIATKISPTTYAVRLHNEVFTNV